MFGIIGVGACGGNIADEGYKRGIPAIAINYSNSDLNSLENIETNKRLHLVGSEGVGRDRDEAVRLMNNNWETILSFIKNEFLTSSIEVILVAFSMGGGSGSGLSSVLLDILINEFSDKTFVAVPVFPKKDDVLISQLNFIKSSEELSKLDICILPVDNENVYKFMDNPNKSEIYDMINSTFIDKLLTIEQYTNKSSKYGILDKKDLHTLFKTSGIMIISDANIADLTNEKIKISEDGFMNKVRDSWFNTIFVEPEIDTVIRSGIIYDGNENFLKFIDVNNLFTIFNNGMPIDLFEGYYFEKNGKVYTILAGLSWYKNRLKIAENIVTNNYKQKKSLLNRTNDYEFHLDEIKEKDKSNQIKGKSIQDILKKYNR